MAEIIINGEPLTEDEGHVLFMAIEDAMSDLRWAEINETIEPDMLARYRHDIQSIRHKMNPLVEPKPQPLTKE